MRSTKSGSTVAPSYPGYSRTVSEVLTIERANFRGCATYGTGTCEKHTHAHTPKNTNINVFVLYTLAHHPYLALHLTSPDSRAGRSVRPNTAVDVDPDTRIVRAISARERYKRARVTVSTTCDTDLGTRDVELGAVGVAGLVQGDVLDAEEIVAGRDVPGDGDADGALVWFKVSKRRS